MKKTTSLFFMLLALTCFAFINPTDKETKQINVVIDAGHGGYDEGSKANNITEKQIIEQIITKIQNLNKNKNVVLHFTRSEDKFIPLKDRTDFINTIQPDLVISLHVNANKNPEKSGLEFYVSKESKSYEKSNEIAEKLQTKFATSNWKVSEVKNVNFYILKVSEVPAVLMEIGYLTNKNDAVMLEDNKEQNQIAKNIVEFISELK